MRGICEEVTHAYFSCYIHKDDFAELNAANSSLFENFLVLSWKYPPILKIALSKPEGSTTMLTYTLWLLLLVKKSPVEKLPSTTSISLRRTFS